MSTKKYAHVAVNDPNGFQNDFSSAYDNQFQNEIPASRRTSPGLLRNLQLRWWCWELVAAALSLALFTAVIIVLKVFDGRALPQLPLDITLNTTVSLIAAVSKTALLLVASATMSQFKWLWIHKSTRKLRDLQVFDEASRGPWGALILLQHSRLSIASLGALITLLLLGFDPFIQQLITTPQRDLSFDARSTAVLKASTFNQYAVLASDTAVNGTLDRLSGVSSIPKIQMTVFTGAGNQVQIEDFAPSCPAANCTWPTFKSLGLCSTCVNVTEYARRNWECENGPSETVAGVVGNNRTCSYHLPNSAFNYEYLIFGNNTNSTEVDGELRLNIWTTRKSQTTFSDNTFLLISRMAFENPPGLVPGTGREQVLEATECALAMCVEEHNLSITLGILDHTIKSSEQPFSMKTDVTSTQFSPTYDVKSMQIEDITYYVDGLYSLPAVLQAIEGTLPGNVTAEYEVTSNPSSPVIYDGSTVPSSTLTASFHAGLNFTLAIENMVTSVSQYIRGLSQDTTIGRAHSVEVYVHVKWEWLAFPAVLVFGGIALLITVMIQTSQSGLEVWKSSSLPLWFHGPQNGKINSFGNPIERVNTLVQMEAEAGQIQVTLERLDDGSGAWKLLPTQNDVKSGYST